MVDYRLWLNGLQVLKNRIFCGIIITGGEERDPHLFSVISGFGCYAVTVMRQQRSNTKTESVSAVSGFETAACQGGNFNYMEHKQGGRMIHLLPDLEYRIHSEKSPEEITMALKSVTDSEKSIFGREKKAEFVGEVYPFGFKIVSHISYRNSFLPVIEGKVKVEENTSVIVIKMRLHLLVRVFLSIWFGMAFFFLLFGILDTMISGMMESSRLLISSGGLIILGQLISRAGFYIPARKAMERLENLL